MDNQSYLLLNIEKGIQNQLISLNADKSQITYYVQESYTTSYKNPEEQVRAAYFCELVLKYKYPTTRIQFEVPLKPDKDRIDILVYKDDECKDPYLVVECKKVGISDAEFQKGVEQAFRYANYKKAWYVVVVAGNIIERFNTKDFKSEERKNNVIGDIPTRYGDPPKYKYYKQEGKDLKIVSRGEFIKILKKSHDTVWQGGKLTPTDAFNEFSKLLFCKLKDEKSTIKNEPYQFQIGTNESPATIFQRIEVIYKKAQQENEEIFKENINLQPEVVFSCLKHLQELAINAIDLDSKGIAFETFMRGFFKGETGQYFTPRNIVRFVVDMMAPKESHRLLDPACGSGGFLLNAMDYVKKYAEKNYKAELEIFQHWQNFANNRLFGIDINDRIAGLCKINMILHNDGCMNIVHGDSLEDIKHIQSLNKKFQKNYFDLILTNPPFGATIKATEKKYLQKYTLGQNKGKVRQSQKTEILFIERCVEFLKFETGKIAIVLPDGILNNSSLQYVRDYILQTCQVLAVISLPQTAFSHYGAGVKSSLLFLRKKGKNEAFQNYPIFMAIAQHIGYDATGRETPYQNDLPKILKQYREFEQTQGIKSPAPVGSAQRKALRTLKQRDDVKPTANWENKIFQVNRDEMEGRIDPYYYKPEFINNYYKIQNIPNKQLGKLIYFSKETRNRAQQDSSRNKYIEIGGIDVKTGDVKKISEIPISEAPSSAKMVVRKNDILISKTRPNRGAISLIDKSFAGFIASTGFAIIRKIKVESLDRKYLFYALRFDSTLKQFEQRSCGAIYPTITKESLGKVLIPLPPKEIQIRIVALMDCAYALKKEKEREAKRLLGNIDAYVFEQLGIYLPEVGCTQCVQGLNDIAPILSLHDAPAIKNKGRCFRINVGDIQGQRFDVEYHQFELAFLNQLKNTITIHEFIINYKKGIEVSSSQYVNEGPLTEEKLIPFVRVSDINNNDLNLKQIDKKISQLLFEELKENFCPKKGELLYTKDGTIGLTYLVTQEQNYIVSSGILRLICKNIEFAKFLKVILSLKIYKKIANRESTGTIIQHLNLKEFLNIPIPFPNKEKRDKIVNKVDEIQAKAQSLKKEATQALEKAQKEVEEILFKT